jgi:ribonucleoside-diphosphate reductase alpha chain
MHISRFFTSDYGGPYKDIVWEKRKSELIGGKGEILFKMDDVIVPKSWSQVATDILAQKYFRKAGVNKCNIYDWREFIKSSGREHLLSIVDEETADPKQKSKYCYNDYEFIKVPCDGGEHDARQVFHRLAFAWMKWGRQYNYFNSEDDAVAFYDEVCYMLSHQIAAPNSPQWFNTGLFDVYGIKGHSQEFYYYDPEKNKVIKTDNTYKRPQTSACFILPVKDELVNKHGIMDTVVSEAKLFKYGSGAGSNFSNIRGKSEKLSGGGISSGLLSFLKINDRSANAIKSGGATRRAAKMAIIDVDHPDIEEFIEWKVKEEHKVASLAVGSTIIIKHARAIYEAVKKYGLNDNKELEEAVGLALQDGVPSTCIYQYLSEINQTGRLMTPEQFSVSWGDESYETVSGQSSNNSVRVTDAFMDAVKNDKDWHLKARTTGETTKVIKARDLWQKIIKSAWVCADPGIQFHDTINSWHTTPKAGEIRSSNPCSEFMAIDGSACNLASINLIKLYEVNAEGNYIFLYDAYVHVIDIWTMILDISITMAQYPSAIIAENSYKYRFLGLGYTGLGSLLMRMGLAYDSAVGRCISSILTSILTGRAYLTSSELASSLGPFIGYNDNKKNMMGIIEKHVQCLVDTRIYNNFVDADYYRLSLPDNNKLKRTLKDLILECQSVWKKVIEAGEKNGFRNAQVTCIAPTGTIGLLMDCDTTGIEPDFALVKFKKLSGGGSFKIVNQSIPIALNNLGYKPSKIIDIVNYVTGTKELDKDEDAGGCKINYNSLIGKNFSDYDLSRVNEELKTATDLRSVFSEYVLGKNVIIENLKCRPGEDILEQLGFTKEDIAKAEDRICGKMTIEGAPHLKEKHYNVFDTASLCGKYGTRMIPYTAHIEMMGAVQPFISGAISKTINMPTNSTYKDINDAYLTSWKIGLKSITIYRDNSKLSQPLSSFGINDKDAIAKIIRNSYRLIRSDEPRLEEQYKKYILCLENKIEADKTVIGLLTDTINKSEETKSGVNKAVRKKLPNRRKGYVQKIKIGGHSLFLHSGEYEDGRLGEIFIDMHREGAAFRSLLNSFAIAISLGLQYGVPLDEFVDAFVFSKFEPNGMVQGHGNIKMVTSVIDYIFRDLAINYLGRTDLAQVKPEDLNSTDVKSHENMNKEADEPDKYYKGFREVWEKAIATGVIGQHALKDDNYISNGENISDEIYKARQKGYEGDPCPSCGSFTLIRNGTCMKCDNCGNTTGCS